MGFKSLQSVAQPLFIEELHNKEFINDMVFMFNMENTDYGYTDTVSNALVFGSEDIKEVMGETKYNSVKWIPVDRTI